MINRVVRLGSIAVVLSLLLLIVGACSSGSGSPSEKSVTSSSSGAPEFAVSSSGGASAGSAATAPSSAASWDRKIIRNADIALRVTSVESTLATIRTITDSAGGVVFASSTSYDGSNQIASLTLDIPADQFDQVVNQLRSASGVKKVEKESISSQDVTDQYVDLQSQLRNLQVTEARLQALMSNAQQLQDILTIQKELSNVEGQIEQTQGRINYLDKHTSFSRITVTLAPVAVVAKTGNGSGTDLGKAVRDAWNASLAFTGGVLTALVKIGVFLWWFWPIALAALAIIAARRQRRRDGRGPEIAA